MPVSCCPGRNKKGGGFCNAADNSVRRNQLYKNKSFRGGTLKIFPTKKLVKIYLNNYKAKSVAIRKVI